MKVILGPTPCATCRQPVTVVRRDVEHPCELTLYSAIRLARRTGGDIDKHRHTHTIPDVGPFTTVDDDGTRHECAG